MTALRGLVLSSVLLTLAGCAALTLVDAQPQTVAAGYTVHPQTTWSRLRQGNTELWTVDGFDLQAVRFFDPIKDGGTLLVTPEREKMPRYRAGMSASEIQEFVVDSLRRAGAAQVKARGLKPVRFGALDGFRFELEFLSGNGLEMSGLVTGAVDGDKLLLISYSGTRAHYFPKQLDHVERMLSSIRPAS